MHGYRLIIHGSALTIGRGNRENQIYIKKEHSSFIKEGFLQTEPIALKSRIYYATTSIMLMIPNLEAGALAAVAAFIVTSLADIGAAAGGVFIAAKADGRGFFFVVFIDVVVVPRPGTE